jgi:hypothetical protein
MEFGLTIVCIGACPAVFVADVISLFVTTFLMMRIMKFAGKNRRLHPEDGRPRNKWILSLLLLWIICSFLSVLASRFLFVTSIHLILGSGICTAFVKPNVLENLIPILGGLLTFSRSIDTKFSKILRILVAFIFSILILVWSWVSVYANIIAYHQYLNSVNTEVADLMASMDAIHFAALGAASAAAIFISLFTKSFANKGKRIFSASNKVFFILGLLTTYVLADVIYTDVCWYLIHQLTDSFVCVIAGMPWCPLAVFTLTWFLHRNPKTKPILNLPTKIRFEQIKSVTACPAMWDDMLGDDKVRYCHLCGKQIYSLNELTYEEAEELRLRKSIYVRKDRAIMESDCFVGLTSIQKATIQLQRYISQLKSKVSR